MPGLEEKLRDALRRVTLLPLDEPIVSAAATLEPALLRALDAIHVATGLSIRGDLAAFVCYDGRLAEAAATAGLPVASPA